MNYTRALMCGLGMYLSFLVVYGVGLLLPFVDAAGLGTSFFVFLGVWMIPIVLVWAKWFFRLVPPSVKHGVLLGAVALIIATVCDLLFIFVLPVFPMSVADVQQLGTNWMAYAVIIELLALTTYAGFEYDRTFTKK
jgi:hypothetical protein